MHMSASHSNKSRSITGNIYTYHIDIQNQALSR